MIALTREAANARYSLMLAKTILDSRQGLMIVLASRVHPTLFGVLLGISKGGNLETRLQGYLERESEGPSENKQPHNTGNRGDGSGS